MSKGMNEGSGWPQRRPCTWAFRPKAHPPAQPPWRSPHGTTAVPKEAPGFSHAHGSTQWSPISRPRGEWEGAGHQAPDPSPPLSMVGAWLGPGDLYLSFFLSRKHT